MRTSYIFLLGGAILAAGCRGERPVFGSASPLSEGTSEDASAAADDDGLASDTTGVEDVGVPGRSDAEEMSAPNSSDEALPLECQEEGLVRCAPDGSAVEGCSASGDWLVREQCTGQTPVCFRGGCVECVAGETICKGSLLGRCSDEGTWTNDECPSGSVCLESTGTCGVCSDGETQCQDETSLGTCSDGEFVPTACPALKPSCVAGSCQACNPSLSAPYCEDGAPVTCTNGEWETQPACTGATPSCNELTGGCASCRPGDVDCTPDGLYATCDEYGQWVPEPCGDEAPVCLGSSCVACDPGAAAPRCRNNATEVCSEGGNWEVVEACSGETPVCLAQTASCGACDEGERQCDDNATGLAVCNAQGQFVETPCPDTSPVCEDGECVECSEGAGQERRCVGDTPQICSSNEWVAQAACNGDTPRCDSATGECLCAEDAYRCHGSGGSSLQQCRNGAWIELETCTGDLPVCDSNAGRCACDTGESKCVVGTDDSVLECQAGWWVEEPCPPEGPVCYDGACRECVPGSPAVCKVPDTSNDYTGSTSEWCSSAAQIQTQSCSFTCLDGECTDTREIAGKFTCRPDRNIACSTGQICCAERSPKCVDTEDECGKKEPGSQLAAQLIRCDDHSDCASGQVCCADFVPPVGASYSSCKAPEDCADRDRYMNSYQGIVCGPNDPCAIGTCVPWGDTGVSVCDES